MKRLTGLKGYPALIGLAALSILGLLWFRASQPPVEPVPPPIASPPPAPSPEPSPSVAAPPSPEPTPIAPSPSPVGEVRQGGLRVSNQTQHPVRVALLPQQPTAEDVRRYNQPVHWDFAPGEGGTKGLILSLPDGEVKLQAGDVLVAFAQDGSRRYWGPYVLGETDAPAWNGQSAEWQMVLQSTDSDD